MPSRWQAELAGGALRDDFCRAGGPTLAGWTISRTVIDGGVSDATFALNQRFPKSVAGEVSCASRARRQEGSDSEWNRSDFFDHGSWLRSCAFRPAENEKSSFETSQQSSMSSIRSRCHDIGMQTTFEGIFFEARDAGGAFVRVRNAYRGEIMGGQWSAERDAYPYPHG
jgi:hypothetical protein